ncbi:hypothetical protein C5167_046196 [Papaver somniferum]|uniref:Kinesin motor domain-containing protein n=1 Tax=Papaver somniferum TaxID=3469 RepID=A0A4Y7LFJ3_PAPSO|nr:hypothetical protein C5167_046196 [Papaver somniferum]
MERIHVSVRPKPLTLEDSKSSSWKINENSITIPNQPTKFEFDHIFKAECKTSEVYELRTRELVSAAVRGFNGTVFAYGQTNSGKTHTMRGSASEPGVIPLAVHDLFRTIQEDMDREFLLRMSYMEIYNEEINDLLAPEHRKLQIHESIDRGIFVAGLREEIVATPEQVLELMDFGESHRHIGETNMNTYSSRSHTIFRMIIESRDRTEDGEVGISCDAVRVSVLSLVDLAGSERAAKTGAEGMRLKEGSHINKSLMTLGTVIKKLSEGAESQGGHVPYRDSKLTRILQPSLGGNANTAIICNITLAQILTDAALLKRQKKEIEELRGKLKGSHSEHFEEEILQLRNTLLTSELERERIALELQEEKRRLQEQAKKIENLSSMVLNSNTDDKRSTFKKDKRRDTWCPGALTQENVKGEVAAASQPKASFEESIRPEGDTGLAVPFEELENKVSSNEILQSTSLSDKIGNIDLPGDCIVPGATALLNVTNRRKPPLHKKSTQDENKLVRMQAEYEDLLVEFETQRTTMDIEIECLTKKLEAKIHLDAPSTCEPCKSNFQGKSEAICTTEQLQEQIKILEMEKSSLQTNLDYYVDLAMGQKTPNEEDSEMAELSVEVGALMLEFQNSKYAAESICSVIDELFQNFSGVLGVFSDLKSSIGPSAVHLNSIIGDHKEMYGCLMKKISELESDKCTLLNQSTSLHKQIEDLKVDLQQSERVLTDRDELHELEKVELLSQIQTLKKEISKLSSCSLEREKEALRKELEKTKLKSKETESKLKNAIHEKTRLEGEKAQAEREIKQLHGQKNLLVRDISRRDSNMFDMKKSRGPAGPSIQMMQGEYEKLEVLAFEMETTIASLEEELKAVSTEKEEVLYNKDILASELEAMSLDLNSANLEKEAMQDELSSMRDNIAESVLSCNKMERAISQMLEEKEELAMQLTNALMDLEEEKAIWSAKEKASIEAIADKGRISNELTQLSKEMLEVRHQLECLRYECKILKETLTLSEENTARERKCSMDKSAEIDQLKLKISVAESENSLDLAKARADADEPIRKLSDMELKIRNDTISNTNEKAKARLRLRGTQIKLDMYRGRYKEAINEKTIMNENFEQAAKRLKEQLRVQVTENVRLRKQQLGREI